MTRGSESRGERRRLKVVLERQLDESRASRPCDGCTACCYSLIVAELGKPLDTMCPHAKGGCGIYEARPKACREFECLWKLGLGTPDLRPDKSGLLFSPTGPGQPGYPGVLVYELWEGAFDEASAFLLETAKRVVLMLMRGGLPKKILGPDHLILGMKTQIEEIRALNARARASRL